jgi:hypothetical protein
MTHQTNEVGFLGNEEFINQFIREANPTEMVEREINSIDLGNKDLKKVMIAVSIMKQFCLEMEERCGVGLRNILLEYPEFTNGKIKKVIIDGYEIKNNGDTVKYNYASCGDTVWNEITTKLGEKAEEIKPLEEERKKREKFLQALAANQDNIASMNTGAEIYAPIVTRTPKAVTIKKKG